MGGRARRERGPVLPGLVVALLSVLVALMLDPSDHGQRLRALVGLDERLADPVTTSGEGEYAVLATQPGSDEPVGWNPCRPVTYAVNPAGAPTGWRDLVGQAVGRVEAATGLDFRDAGVTDDRDFQAGRRILGRPGPVLIGWADAEEVPALAGEVAGIGGGVATDRAGRLTYVSGTVALDTEIFDRLDEQGDEGWAAMRAILMHELAHVVGLDHVDDERELMHDDNLGRTDFGPGDLTGLARLGALPCG